MSILSNIAYIIAGLAIYPLAPAWFCFVLAFGSGLHHWKMQPWSRKFDFIAMYGITISLICLPLAFWINVAVSIGLALTLYFVFGNGPNLVAIGIGTLLVIVLMHGLWVEFLTLSGIGGIAYFFNLAGEDFHGEQYELAHSLWHTFSAIGIYYVTTVL